MHLLPRSLIGLALVCVFLAPACSGDDGNERPRFAESYPLPFGLVQADGTEPIGRPVVFDTALLSYGGDPIMGTELHTAYRVTAEPGGVLRGWVNQLAKLDMVPEMQLRIGGTDSDEAWMSASGFGSAPAFSASIDLQIWVTKDDPILLVNVERAAAQPPDDGLPTQIHEFVSSGAPAAADLQQDRGPGDDLVEEDGFALHLPDGALALMPTFVHVQGLIGDSRSLLSAADPVAAIQALVDQAKAQRDDGAEVEPTKTRQGDLDIVTGSYGIAGGGSFEAIAVRGPDDPAATIYLTSATD